MPVKPKRPCSKPGCRNLTEGRYCEDHAHLAEMSRKERHKRYDEQQRDKKAAAFYRSVEWERAREQALIRDHGLCQDCLLDQRITPAVPVDHIIPIRIRWDLRLTLSNLRSLCNWHHAIKTAADKRKYGGCYALKPTHINPQRKGDSE
ncbi:HNH endonuclease [Cohnella massiliensis]|uniref:HNH endonuclease n=1 Tax=Cohnella massiliensis TaxID=1816691 RepID=UPI0009BA128A|nr:HNH endonuclease [Cohnella massiliensis]